MRVKGISYDLMGIYRDLMEIYLELIGDLMGISWICEDLSMILSNSSGKYHGLTSNLAFIAI